jgi:hypothetical protein
MAKKPKQERASHGKQSLATNKTKIVATKQTERFVVHGVVSYPDKSLAAGLTVIAFDQDEIGKNRLGESVTDAEGNYRIEYCANDFRLSTNEKGGADIFVRVYSSQGALLFHSDTVRSAPADLRLDANLPAVQFVVRGRVIGGDRGQLVRAYDVDLRGEELLGYDFIDATGNFEIPYSPRKFKRAEIGTADLRVSVRLQDGGAHSSEIFYNAAADKTVNLEISIDSAADPLPYLEGDRRAVYMFGRSRTNAAFAGNWAMSLLGSGSSPGTNSTFRSPGFRPIKRRRPHSQQFQCGSSHDNVVDLTSYDSGAKHMNKKPVLVDLEKLRALIAGLDLGDQKWNEYIDARWLNYVERWDSRASFAIRQKVEPVPPRGFKELPAPTGASAVAGPVMKEFDMVLKVGKVDHGPKFAARD